MRKFKENKRTFFGLTGDVTTAGASGMGLLV